MFGGVARRGLANRLAQAGVPIGVSLTLADANYPDKNGNYDFLRALQSVTTQQARGLTRLFLEERRGTLDDLLRGLYGANCAQAVALLQEMEEAATIIGRLRREG